MSDSIDIINAFALLTNFVILPALSYGSQLALGALAVTLVYSILRFSNFAQGDSMAFGTMLVIIISGYMISKGWTITGFPTAILAIPLALIGMSIYLLAMDRLVYRHYRKIKAKQNIVGITASIGVMFVTGGIVRFILGASAQGLVMARDLFFLLENSKHSLGFSRELPLRHHNF